MAVIEKTLENIVPLRNVLLILVISFSLTSHVNSSSASASCPKDSSEDCSPPDSPPADSTDLQSGASIVTWIKDSFSTPPLENIISIDSNLDLSASVADDSSNSVQESSSDALQQNEALSTNKLSASLAEGSSNAVQESSSDALQQNEAMSTNKMSTSLAEESSNAVQESSSDNLQQNEAMSTNGLSDDEQSGRPFSVQVDETDSLPTETLSNTLPVVDAVDLFAAEKDPSLRKDVSATPNQKDEITDSQDDDIFYKLIDVVANQYKPRDSFFFRKDEMPSLSSKESSDTPIPSVVSKQDESNGPDLLQDMTNLSTEESADIHGSKDSVAVQQEVSNLSGNPSETDEKDSLEEDLPATPPQVKSKSDPTDDSFYYWMSKLADIPASTDTIAIQQNNMEDLSKETSLNIQSTDPMTVSEDLSITSPQTDSPTDSEVSTSDADDSSSLSIQFSFSMSVSDSNIDDDEKMTTKETPSSQRQDRSGGVLRENCKKVEDLPIIADKLQDPCRSITTKGITKKDIEEDRPQVVPQFYSLFLEHVEFLKCNLATMMRENILKQCTKLGLPSLERIPTAKDLEPLKPDQVVYLYYASLLNHSAHVHFLVHQMENYDYSCTASYRQDARLPTTQMSKKLQHVMCFLKLLLLGTYDQYDDVHFSGTSNAVLCRPTACSGRHLHLCQVVISLDKVLTGLVNYVEWNVLAEGLGLPSRPGIAERCRFEN